MFNATTEQQQILSNVLKGESLVINAFAGTGKTSTLEYITRNYPKRTLYMAFNKVAADEAAARMPSNVECRTIHSLAYQAICKGSSFAKRIQGYYDYREIGSLIREFTTPKSEGECIDRVIGIIKAYCNSAYNDIDNVRLEFPDLTNNDFEVAAKAAKVVWDAMVDEKGKTKITHDIYMKLYQLSKPSLAQYELLLLDEAQDSNPVTLDIISNQLQQRILVGDKYQAIYKWRGSVNAMDSFPTFIRMYLTESFRFGQDIADRANILLKAMGSTVSMSGIGGNKDTGTVANLVRSNSTLYREMLRNVEEGNSVYVEADLKELWSAFYTLHAMRFAFYNGSDVEWPKYPNKQFQSYGTWETVVKVENPEVSRIAKLVEKGYGTHKEISSIKCQLVDDKAKADIVILTGHKSKGSEFTRVYVAGDFIPTDYRDDGYSKKSMDTFIEEQGANLLYVAMTRATQELVTDEEIDMFLDDVARNS